MIAPAIPATVAPMSLDTVWLSYSELADRLGIAPESARNLVRRREWPRKPGNDGTQRIGVPQDYLDERAREQAAEPPIEAAIVVPIEPPVEAPVEGAVMAALEAHIETLKGTVEHERARADKEQARADALAAELVKLQADDGTKVANVERDVAQLRAVLDEMRRPAAAPEAPAWLRWIATARAGRPA